MQPLDPQTPEDAKRENKSGFLMKMFGPSRRQVWEALAREIGGTFTTGAITPGTYWNGRDKVVADVGPWQVTLDTYVVSTGKSTVRVTRMRAPYVNPDGFRFDIRRRNMFDGIAEAFGFHDVQVGFPEFDHAFIIKGTDEQKLRKLFSNPRLRALMSAEPIHLQVSDDEGSYRKTFPQGVDELAFSIRGAIKDIDRLKQLFDLFAETLHTLCHIGSAYEDDPKIVLD